MAEQPPKFSLWQEIYLTGGPNGNLKRKGRIIKGPRDDGRFVKHYVARMEQSFGLFDGDSVYCWGKGSAIWFSPDGSVLGSDCKVVFAEDPDLVGLRESFAVELENYGLKVTASNYRDGINNNRPEMRAALAYVKKIRAKYEGDG